MQRPMVLLSSLLVAACGEDPHEDVPLRGRCGPDAPEIVDVGLRPGVAPTGDPGLAVDVFATDSDGGLFTGFFLLTLDFEVDGEVEFGTQSVSWPFNHEPIELGSESDFERCAQFELDAEPFLWVTMDGDSRPFASPVEVAVLLLDSDYRESEMRIVEGCTPTPEGAPGC